MQARPDGRLQISVDKGFVDPHKDLSRSLAYLANGLLDQSPCLSLACVEHTVFQVESNCISVMPPGAADKAGIGDRHHQIRAPNKHDSTISTRLGRCWRRGRLHTGDRLGLGTVALGTQLGPLQRIARPGSLIAVNDAAIDLAPGLPAAGELPVLCEHPVGVAYVLIRGRKPSVLWFNHRWI